MSERYQINIQNPEHIPAPRVPEWFREELSRSLPHNPYGEAQLIVGWGMDLTTFRNGNPHDAKYIAVHEKITKRKFRRLDIVEGVYEYFDTRQQAMDALNINLGVHPQTQQPLIEYKQMREIRHWGPPLFLVEQWYPPERIDPPEVWARNRHAVIQDRIGQKIKLDVLGPYPSRGQYRELMQIADVDGAFLWEVAIADIRRRIKARELYSYNDHTDAQELRDVYSAEAQKLAAIDTIIDESFDDFASTSKYRMTGLGPVWPKVTPRNHQSSTSQTQGAP